jgi:hypothetical protein
LLQVFREEEASMSRTVVTLLTVGLALAAGCAREDPEARLPGAYDRQLEKAQQVEETLQQSAEDRLQQLDAGN